MSSTERRRRRGVLLAIQGGKCFWCEEEIVEADATLDELMPRNRGGTQRWNNIVVSCSFCNNSRGDFIAPRWAFEKIKSREEERCKELAGVAGIEPA